MKNYCQYCTPFDEENGRRSDFFPEDFIDKRFRFKSDSPLPIYVYMQCTVYSSCSEAGKGKMMIGAGVDDHLGNHPIFVAERKIKFCPMCGRKL